MLAYKREIALILLTLLVLAGVWALVSRVGASSGAAQTDFVTQAVHNAAVTCYAVEGAYPMDLDYLRSNYGLAYDQSRYMVRYSWVGSNMLPDITVTEVEVTGA